MLTHLTISNYAIARQIDLNFDCGMTVLTGETGAGKSITLDALGLVLGDRADSKAVGEDGKRAEIHAGFDVSNNQDVMRWLAERDMLQSSELQLRRVIFADGKSRAYINGRPATLQDLKTLGANLVEIHGQHDHQSLLKHDTQRTLLDNYAGTGKLGAAVAAKSRICKQLQQRLNSLKNQSQEQSARVQLLRYQAEELEQLDLQPGELQALEQEQATLAQAEDAMTSCQEALQLSKNDDAGTSITLSRAIRILEQITHPGKSLEAALQLFASAQIQIEEAEHSIKEHIDGFEFDPRQLQEVEDRLSAIYHIARKHRLPPADIPALQGQLMLELENLGGDDEVLAELERDLGSNQEQLQCMARKLSDARQKAATTLSKAVNRLLKELCMLNCHFEIALTPLKQASSQGLEDIEFRVSTHSGQPPQALARIASGGELSRIGLAIQVATTDANHTPTLVFDEVDAGIGGGVAEVVGNLLRQLGESCQVFCITHLAQVACKGHQHFVVSKNNGKKTTKTRVSCLKEDDKVAEIARMLGGIAITEQTRAHAREMLTTRH